ncbi:MICAL-like protein 1 [Eumeta japonica]|uniref:MICAL-like protein 1 n=1 Tax=Eumeta variegata TaxID=151549 RepID=A0A4C1WZZ7_EUMVA|nr:MICAL-like protein 1 [Eumeta japonica]
MFEKGFGDNEDINDKVEKLSLKEERKELVKPELMNSEKDSKINNESVATDDKNVLPKSSVVDAKSSISETNIESDKINGDTENSRSVHISETLYKTDINKFNFLQTQLSSDIIEEDVATSPPLMPNSIPPKNESPVTPDNISNSTSREHNENVNMTDEHRLASNNDMNNKFNIEATDTKNATIINNYEDSTNECKTEVKEVIPPRRKKQIIVDKATDTIQNKQKIDADIKAYPDHLNPFSDEEDEIIQVTKKRMSTNPFGSSDEEEDDVSACQESTSSHILQSSTPVKRLIPALNPFWSDGEEPSSEDEDSNVQSASMYSKSSMTTSTPNFPTAMPRKKPRAPPPPTITLVKATENDSHLHSMDDVASLSSKTSVKLTPRPKKKRPAPTPSDSISYLSTGSRDLQKSNTDLADKSLDSTGHTNNADGCTRKVKGPAPGLPLPERREVKPHMSPEELQVQLDLLEAQQLGLERQGVLIEQMIRDRCEGDESTSVSQEEVEDLVIQLCELVNEKNDLFRKQTELMYIRRQQRLEQEQADIEHEIRIIQSRPAVNRIDADKAREEHLVSRLVEIVRLRDELVQQLDAERRREIQEDLAIAASIAERRAQRNSDSNTSSMASVEMGRTPKKTKVKDKVKRQFKKAKHSLNIKKKDEQDSPVKDKEKSTEKVHKTKWF